MRVFSQLYSFFRRKNLASIAVTSVLLMSVVAGIYLVQRSQEFREKAATTADSFTISVTPQTVFANGSYTITFKLNGVPYVNGMVDFDVLMCPLTGLVSTTTKKLDQSKCSVSRGPWGTYVTNTSGNITIPIENYDGNGGKVPDGFEFVRYKPRNSTLPYSNQIAIVIDRTSRAPVAQSNSHPVIKFTPGAYDVFDDYDAGTGQYRGRSKVEIEQEVCTGVDNSKGFIERFTKNSEIAYWGEQGPGQAIKSLRWCVGPYVQNAKNIRSLAIQDNTTFFPIDTNKSSLSVTQYPNSYGFMGAITFRGNQNPIPGNQYHYTLAPVDLFPATLPTEFTTVIWRDSAYSAYASIYNQFDNWSTQVRKSRLGGAYEVRYQEWSIFVNNLPGTTLNPTVSDWDPKIGFNVVEDYDWNANGTLNQITQQLGCHYLGGDCTVPAVDCTHTNSCNAPFRHKLTKQYGWVPNNQPFTLSLEGGTGTPTNMCFIQGNPYTLRVRTSDGKDYDGFLQLQSSTAPFVWFAVNYYPVYVNAGKVVVLPGAYGGGTSTSTFSARQQLLNSNIAVNVALNTSPGGINQPNSTTQPFSNSVTVVVALSCTPPTGTPTPTLVSTSTPTPTKTGTPTPTATNTSTPTRTPTPTATFTPTPTASRTPTPTLTPTRTPTPTSTATRTPTPIFTATSTPTFIATTTSTNTVTPHATNTSTPIPLPGDANNDGVVDGIDFVAWLNHYGQNISGVSNGDYNGDGKVDGVDYVVWLQNYGRRR